MQEIKYIIYARKKKKHLQKPHLDFANAVSSTHKAQAR